MHKLEFEEHLHIKILITFYIFISKTLFRKNTFIFHLILFANVKFQVNWIKIFEIHTSKFR